MPIPPILRAESLAHHRAPPGELHSLSLAIEPGRFTLLSGGADSGAGILLRILSLLERPDSGELWFDSRPTAALDDAARLALRNSQFGFQFAEPFLLDSFSVAENVAMPLFKISKFDIEQARARTAEVLQFAGLATVADLSVFDLSALDHHKLSLARALAGAPRVLIAENAGLHLPASDFREFAALLRSLPGLLGITVIATSPAGPEILNPDREIRLEHGLLAADSQPILPAQEAPARD
jgi:ABC-type lipoprotein export system ATPase subunit